MKVFANQTCFRYCTYAGCFLIMFPSTITWYWGNLRVYIDSYFRARLGPESGFETPWTVSLAAIGMPFGVSLGGCAGRFLGRHWIVAIGCVICDLALGISYFAVQISVLFLSFIFGFTIGFGFGMIYGQIFEIIEDCCPSTKTGLITSVVTVSVGVGPLVSIQIITHFINPDNEIPDLIGYGNVFFTEETLLERVPGAFLVLLGSAVSFHCVGFFFIMTPRCMQLLDRSKGEIIDCNKDLGYSNEDQKTGNHGNESLTLSLSQKYQASYNNESCVQQPVNSNATHKTQTMNEKTETRNYPCGCVDNVLNGTKKSADSTQNACCRHESSDPDEAQDPRAQVLEDSSDNSKHLSPSQLLRNPTFYIMWFCVNCNDFCFILITNYYKTYGQLYIKDDHFLADVGTLIMVGVICTRVLWGLIIDHIEIKSGYILLTSGFCFGLSFWFFTVHVNKWFYLIWTVLLGTLNGGFFFISAMGTLKMFGKTHYSKNLGLLISGTIPVNLFGPPLIGLILHHWGYLALVLIGASLAAVDVVLLVLFFPGKEPK